MQNNWINMLSKGCKYMLFRILLDSMGPKSHRYVRPLQMICMQTFNRNLLYFSKNLLSIKYKHHFLYIVSFSHKAFEVSHFYLLYFCFFEDFDLLISYLFRSKPI